MELIRSWFERYFSDPQAILLLVVLAVGFGVVLTMGQMLAPLLASIVIAYLLEGVVAYLVAKGSLRLPTVVLVFLLFMTFLLFTIFGLSPLLWNQTAELIRESPNYMNEAQVALMELPKHYPFISEELLTDFFQVIRSQMALIGREALTLSLGSFQAVVTMLIYLILVPLLVFFFLKDKGIILRWATSFLPTEKKLVDHVWSEVDMQIGNYVRGKFWEILIVGISTTVLFFIMGMKYAMLLGVLVGLSVLVPYIGAVVVTIPVTLIAYFQWGWGSEFLWLMAVYGVIQGLDGNILVPLLFSEVVNLHPVAIITAILVFGGLWGFWGVFFAIPLATLVNAIIIAWPRPQMRSQSTSEA